MWPNEEETVELMRRARAGEARAVDCLLDRHREALARMVRSRLKGGMARRVDASDVVQDALFTASRRLSEYLRDPRMPFHAWLRQLASDRLNDVYRRHLADKRNVAREQSGRLNQGSLDGRSSFAPAALVADGELTPAAMLMRKEIAARFDVAVDRLTGGAREIVFMRHHEQLTNAQSAEVLGISEQAAAMRYLRALRQLKTVLGDTPSAWLE